MLVRWLHQCYVSSIAMKLFSGGAGRAARSVAGFGEAQRSMAGHGLMFGYQNAFFFKTIQSLNQFKSKKICCDFPEATHECPRSFFYTSL